MSGVQRIKGAEFVTPLPPKPERAPTGLDVLRTIRTNALGLWPAEAYSEPCFVNPIIGSKSVFLLNEPEAIRHVLVENEENFVRSPMRIRLLRPLLGNGVLLSEGDDWRRQRRVLAPAFAPRAMPLLMPHFSATTRKALGTLEEDRSQSLDIFSYFIKWALNSTAQALFSMEFDHQADALRELELRYLRDFVQPSMLDILLPAFIPTPRDLRRKRFSREWMKVIQDAIDARSKLPSDAEPSNLLDVLRNFREADGTPSFNAAELRDQVATLVVAGHVTTSASMFWCAYLLSQNPAAQDRVARELADIDLELATSEDFGRMPYLRAVYNEALRLYPPAFMIVRQSVRTDRVGSLVIPAGSTVLVSPWVVHRHRGLWNDPDTFLPERFLAPEQPPHRYAFIPFGTGPRVCVGAQVATLMSMLLVGSLVKKFRLSIPDPRPVLPVCVDITRPDHMVEMRLDPR